MNHQPFREWLLSEQQLTLEQTKLLQDHLSSCDSCSRLENSWKEIEDVIHKIPPAEPVSGFTGRWQSHLAEYQLLRQKRRGWFIISGTAVFVISLLSILISQIWSLVQTPGPYLAMWFERLVGIISMYYSLRNIVSSYSLPTPLVTFTIVIFLVGMISFMSVLWLATYRKFSLARRAA
ncbi:MAG: hypothetical protein WAV05_01085 [Anaerolineales bacterium]